MKRWKIALIIALLIASLVGLSSCSAYYKPENSNWVFQVW